MDRGLIGLAFAAGLVAALNPCGFAMLPAYLLLVVQGQQHGDRPDRAPLGRALSATLGMALGFVTVFGAFGALTISAATTVQRYVPYATVVVGVLLVGLGAWLLAGRALVIARAAPLAARWAPNARLSSMYGYGVGYAIASLSCTVGPFLAVTAAGLRARSPLTAGLVYLAYLAGLTLIVGVLAMAAATASAAVVERLRRLLPFVNRIGGALLTLVGVYVTYYGYYELRLLHSDGDPRDAVITAAGRVAGAVTGWVHSHGMWPWLGILGVLAIGVAVRRRGARREPVPSGSSRAGDPTGRGSR